MKFPAVVFTALPFEKVNSLVQEHNIVILATEIELEVINATMPPFTHHMQSIKPKNNITSKFYPIPETSDTMLPRAAAETKSGNWLYLLWK